MIHVITAANRHLYARHIEEHYRIRYDIYVRERRWMALDRPDQREIDQFDTEDAIYLLANENDRVIGGTRLVPTLAPHLMSEIFPYLASTRGVQRGPTIYEWTRIFVIKDKRGENSRVLNTILAAMHEFCLEEGVTHITVVMETWWMPRFLALGWKFVPLGLPEPHEDMNIIATMIEVSEETLVKTMAVNNLQSPVILRQGMQRDALSASGSQP